MHSEWQIRIYTHEQGGFVHCRVFTGPIGNSNNCGNLNFYKEEMDKVRERMPGVIWMEDGYNQLEIGN